MNANDGIIGIYNYQSLNFGDDPAYYLLFLFNEDGCLEQRSLMALYDEVFSTDRLEEQTRFVGPFDGLDSLNKYAFKVCDELSSPKIILHSVEEYNASMEKTSTAEEFQEALISGGNVIENLDLDSKKGLLSKIFSKD
jgi:hypothetical protein